MVIEVDGLDVEVPGRRLITGAGFTLERGQRLVEVITGPEARVRLLDRGAKLAVMSMVASFREGDLLGGLLSGLRMLADQAGARRHLR